MYRYSRGLILITLTVFFSAIFSCSPKSGSGSSVSIDDSEGLEEGQPVVGEEDQPVEQDAAIVYPVEDEDGPFLEPGNEPPVASSGIGYSVAGSADLVYWGDIVTAEGIIEDGQMFIGSDGIIKYVGRDASGVDGYEAATKLICYDGIAAPGLIDIRRHTSYTNNDPYALQGDERYEHRHDWRRGQRSHTKININSASLTWIDELRMLLGGCTSTAWSGTNGAFIRNFCGDDFGLGTGGRETFPLSDSSGLQTTDVNAYGDYPALSTIDSFSLSSVYVISEGVDNEARTEFLAVSGETSAKDNILCPKLVISGAIGLVNADYKKIADSGASIAWSPRNDISLYGDTVRVTVFDGYGGNICLASVWEITGSENLLHELQAVASFNTNNLNDYFSKKDVFEMAAINGAIAMGVDSKLGSLEAGKLADFVVYAKNDYRGYAAILNAQPADVASVFISSEIMYGDSYIVANLYNASIGYETLNIGLIEKRIYTTREGSYSVTSVDVNYPLNFADDFDNTRSAVPARLEASDPHNYTGVPSDNDNDGDGIIDSEDNAPLLFNPIRTVDNSTQQVMIVDI